MLQGSHIVLTGHMATNKITTVGHQGASELWCEKQKLKLPRRLPSPREKKKKVNWQLAFEEKKE